MPCANVGITQRRPSRSTSMRSLRYAVKSDEPKHALYAKSLWATTPGRFPLMG
jgi:hypothetical protein